MFCGKPLEKVVSPKGAKAKYGFKTSKGSEYVLAEDRMSQRIKKAGLADDGLHRWMDRSVFVEYRLRPARLAADHRAAAVLPTPAADHL